MYKLPKQVSNSFVLSYEQKYNIAKRQGPAEIGFSFDSEYSNLHIKEVFVGTYDQVYIPDRGLISCHTHPYARPPSGTDLVGSIIASLTSNSLIYTGIVFDGIGFWIFRLSAQTMNLFSSAPLVKQGVHLDNKQARCIDIISENVNTAAVALIQEKQIIKNIYQRFGYMPDKYKPINFAEYLNQIKIALHGNHATPNIHITYIPHSTEDIFVNF